jgi:hypothetical protein
MLLENIIVAGDIVTLKLTSGEEVIAKFVSEEEKIYTVGKPHVLAQGPNGRMVLFPYIITADNVDLIPMLKTAVVTPPIKSNAGVKNSYVEFTSGIMKASSVPDLSTLQAVTT